MICLKNKDDFVLSNFSRREIFRWLCKMSSEAEEQGGELFPGKKKQTCPVLYQLAENA